METLFVAVDDVGVFVVGIISNAAVVCEIEPHGVDSESVDGEVRVDDVAGGFGHFLMTKGPVGVRQDLTGKGEVESHQERGPVDAVETQEELASAGADESNRTGLCLCQ